MESNGSAFPAATSRDYKQLICEWFGEVRPLRLEGVGTFMRAPAALPLAGVYVPPALSESYIYPEVSEPDINAHVDVMEALGRSQRLVVLGDPGSGKSTLVSWLAWRLCAGLTAPLPEWAMELIPIPLVLRDLSLSKAGTFDSLLDAFFESQMFSAGGTRIKQIESGLRRLLAEAPENVLLLVDGLDEIPLEARRRVRHAISEKVSSVPAIRMLATSRVVGYEECPLDVALPNAAKGLIGLTEKSPDALEKFVAIKYAEVSGGDSNASRVALRCYIVPFDRRRIEQFARNWFAYAEAHDPRGESKCQKFIENLTSDPIALQLGRTPNLLVMAAQVFGIDHTLPDGRAQLYDAITKAYLESVDRLYGLPGDRHSLQEKKAWLGRVAYEMQKRRVAFREDARELLVKEVEVVAWLGAAMRDSGLVAEETYVQSFVDAIARRSGLFIPRGEGLYAFMHLSIQEYFCAIYYQRLLRETAYTAKPAELRKLLAELRRNAGLTDWRETLVTLFELPDWSPRELAKNWHELFGLMLNGELLANSEAFSAGKRKRISVVAGLLARLCTNPKVVASASDKQRGFDAAWQQVLLTKKDQDIFIGYLDSDGVLEMLTANEIGRRQVQTLIPSSMSNWSVLGLQSVQLDDYSPLLKLKKLKALSVQVGEQIHLEQIGQIHSMQRLLITAKARKLFDAAPIGAMTSLQELWMTGLSLKRLNFVKRLRQLKGLVIIGGSIQEKINHEDLMHLEKLYLSYSNAKDYKFIQYLVNIKNLDIGGSSIRDISFLKNLGRLTHLDIAGCHISDFSPLESLQSIEMLNLYGTNVDDLSFLRNLPRLNYVNFSNTPAAENYHVGSAHRAYLARGKDGIVLPRRRKGK